MAGVTDQQIELTAKYLLSRDKLKAIILASLLKLSRENDIVTSDDVLSAVRKKIEELGMVYTSPNIVMQLNKLKKMGLVDYTTPIGLKKPKFWMLTDKGTKLAEKIIELDGKLGE